MASWRDTDPPQKLTPAEKTTILDDYSTSYRYDLDRLPTASGVYNYLVDYCPEVQLGPDNKLKLKDRFLKGTPYIVMGTLLIKMTAKQSGAGTGEEPNNDDDQSEVDEELDELR